MYHVLIQVSNGQKDVLHWSLHPSLLIEFCKRKEETKRYVSPIQGYTLITNVTLRLVLRTCKYIGVLTDGHQGGFNE